MVPADPAEPGQLQEDVAPSAQPVVVPVAVVIPAYRRKDLLRRALGSVAAQHGVKPLQVIVVDDASGDGTAELARSLGAEVLEKQANEGQSAARNDAARIAHDAEWVAFLDHDDEWLPDHLSTLWSKRDGHVMVGGAGRAVGARKPRVFGTPERDGEVVRSPARLVFPENSFTTSAVMVRKDVLIAAGGFDTDLWYAQDLDAWVRVLEKGTGLLLPKVTCNYYLHAGQLSRDWRAMRVDCEHVVEKYRDRPWMGRAKERFTVVGVWDALQRARAQHDWGEAGRSALWFLARPARVTALVRLWWFRWRVRHRDW